MRAAFICDAVRTPIGSFGGALANVRADDLAARPIRALMARNPDLDPASIDEVFLGGANQAGEDNRNVARMAALLAGLPETVPGSTINRLCASGADAVGTAARAIVSGEIDLAIAGGAESMTRAPFVVAKAHTPFSRTANMEDTTIGWRFVNPHLQEEYGTASMPETAENVATAFVVGRDAQDAFALQSQRRVATARDFLAAEIVPVELADKKGNLTIIREDEHPRPATSIAKLASLKPIVHSDGTVTAGNASGVNDGAAAMFVASEDAAVRHMLTPRARVGHGHGRSVARPDGYRTGSGGA